MAAENGLVVEARAVLDEIGLADRAATAVTALAHGEQRALEVGLALATRPKLLLLDEPMAGTGPEESQRMIALIRRVRSATTILLIEHDVDAVFRLADRVSVMVDGRLIASGPPGWSGVTPRWSGPISGTSRGNRHWARPVRGNVAGVRAADAAKR